MHIETRYFLLVVFFSCYLVGCGSQKTVLPTTAFTEEQIKAIQAEDQHIEDEESQGSNKKPKRKK